MLYETAHFWRNAKGEIWHALQGAPQFRDLSMGICHSSGDETLMQMSYQKTLAWCRMHNMQIVDEVPPEFIGPKFARKG